VFPVVSAPKMQGPRELTAYFYNKLQDRIITKTNIKRMKTLLMSSFKLQTWSCFR